MATMTDTSTGSEVEILNLLDFESEETCEWLDGCPNKVEWLVLCGICRSSEGICTEHHIALKKQMKAIPFEFTFTRSCGHTVPCDECPIVPMG